jgi:transcriptional regulator with XRE-family HTH domain
MPSRPILRAWRNTTSPGWVRCSFKRSPAGCRGASSPASPCASRAALGASPGRPVQAGRRRIDKLGQHVRVNLAPHVNADINVVVEIIACYNHAMQQHRTKSVTQVDQNVGTRVRMRRLMLKLSQSALADRIGITFQQVQKYEKGMNRIGASRLQQIARVLQVPVTFFFETASPHPPVAEDQSLETLNHFMSTRDGLTLAKAFMRIGDIQLRRRIVDLVEHIEQNQ